MAANKRPNRVVDGVKPMEAVLDIVVPFSEAQPITALRSGDNLRIPDASNNAFVCIAAFYPLQRNIASGTVHEGPGPNRQKKRPPEAAASTAFRDVAYSAATLRGGSSAPE